MAFWPTPFTSYTRAVQIADKRPGTSLRGMMHNSCARCIDIDCGQHVSIESIQHLLDGCTCVFSLLEHVQKALVVLIDCRPVLLCPVGTLLEGLPLSLLDVSRILLLPARRPLRKCTSASLLCLVRLDAFLTIAIRFTLSLSGFTLKPARCRPQQFCAYPHE